MRLMPSLQRLFLQHGLIGLSLCGSQELQPWECALGEWYSANAWRRHDTPSLPSGLLQRCQASRGVLPSHGRYSFFSRVGPPERADVMWSLVGASAVWHGFVAAPLALKRLYPKQPAAPWYRAAETLRSPRAGS